MDNDSTIKEQFYGNGMIASKINYNDESRVLQKIYSLLYNKEFSIYSNNDRMTLQGCIYLLIELGVPVADYRFSEYKTGMFSYDISYMNFTNDYNEEDIQFTTETLETINNLAKTIKVYGSVYDTPVWVSCLALMYHLKKNVLHLDTIDEEVLKEFKSRYPYFSDDDTNKMALLRVYTLLKGPELTKALID